MIRQTRRATGPLGRLASVLVAGILVALKLWALAETGALSIAASLADSALDLMMSLGAAAAIVYAARPADEDHAFGHTSAEDLAALAQSAFILASSAVIGWSAIRRLMADTPHQLASEGRGLVVMVASILITLALVWWQGRVARRTGSKVVAADRLHYLGDLLPSLGAIAALWVSSRYGIGVHRRRGGFGRRRRDDRRRAAHRQGRLGRADGPHRRPRIIEGIARIAADWPGVRGYHDLKTRTAGSRVFVNLHIELDGDQSLRQAHDIGAACGGRSLPPIPRPM
jgi:ferrous-iron efflux pump FieF